MLNHKLHLKHRRIIAVVLTPIWVGVLFLTGLHALPVAAQDQPARTSPPYDPAQVTTPTTLPFAAAGRVSYLENCAPCHGEQGRADGPTAGDLPSPATAFADAAALWERSPAQLFHTTKFGRLEKLMPPWSNRLTDDEIWNTVAYAWSLHTDADKSALGEQLYAANCAACHGATGAGDGPQAPGQINDFTDLSYTIFASQAAWLDGWQTAHPEIGADWTQTQKENTLEYIRTFSYIPPWASPYRPGAGVITGTVVFGTDAPQQVEGGNVFLDAYLGFDQIASFTTTLGADNTFRFEDLAVDPNVTYLATALADGISYSSGMVSLTPDQPTAATSVNIYAVTDSPDAIRINRAHWILESQPGALVVVQIYLMGNDGERTFVGQKVEGVDVPVTVGFQVPADAVELSFENGALGNRFRRVGDMVYDTMPVVPGTNTQQIIVQYAIPHDGASLDLKQKFVYPVDSLSLLIANYPSLRVDAPMLTFDSVQNIQGAEYQVWGQTALGPGTVEVKLQGLLEQGAVDPRTATSSGASQLATIDPPMEAWATWVMIALVGAILLGVVGVALQRGTLNAATTRQDLHVLRNALVTQIAHLDDQHALGQINDAEWLRRRTNLKAQLMDVVRRIEAGSHTSQPKVSSG